MGLRGESLKKPNRVLKSNLPHSCHSPPIDGWLLHNECLVSVKLFLHFPQAHYRHNAKLAHLFLLCVKMGWN